MKGKIAKHSNLTRIKWVVRDKEKFENLVQRLSELVTNLEKLLPAQDGNKDEISMLKRGLQPSIDVNIDQIKVVDDAIAQRCYSMILDQLWFRLIDDRKDSIAKKHPKTLKWAINPPSGKRTWDDLSEWLRQGNGIYWISGKPGSGKSTLMKYLLEHPDVQCMLKQWAGNRDLTVASFFIWNIGSVEQNSQQGLARGLLYHVLQQNKSLIPIVLPGMWKEAQNGNIQLNLPSKSEMDEAFRKLGNVTESGAYAFFIDGIDEFAGNYREGILFIKKLAENSNIKLLVSSRPIHACEAAFASKPKLALQNLTKHDIDIYITDTIRSQSYVIDKMLKEDTVSHLINDLKRKAEGVFLWVVLACRTLVDGFEAYDSLEELQRRVEELPVELEDLFRHILGKIPPRFLSHTAKLLRVCWTSRQLDNKENFLSQHWVPALGLTCVDEHGFEIDAACNFKECTREGKRHELSRLKGRLTSRCMGLLEIHGISKDIDTLKDNEFHYLSVNFMHRTVFEFLSMPKIWDMACLDVHDQNFDAMTILLYISAQALYLQATLLEYDYGLIYQSLDYLMLLEGSASINLLSAVKGFTSAFMHLIWEGKGFQTSRLIVDPHEHKTNENSPDGSCSSSTIDIMDSKQKPGYNQDSLPLDHATLLMAIGFDFSSCISERDIKAFEEARTQFQHPLLHYPLLYHAFNHPLLTKFALFYAECGYLMWYNGLRRAPPVQAIRELLNHGCNPNETFSDNKGVITTPFREWINGCVRATESILDREYALQMAEITWLMLKSSANLKSLNREGIFDPKAGNWKATLMHSTNIWLRASTDMKKTHEADLTKLVEYCNKIQQAIAEEE